MRWLSHIILSVLFIGSLYIWIMPIIRDLWQQSQLAKQSSEQARASNYFPLISDKWLAFDIVNPNRLFRFYFHGALLETDNTKARSFKITYQWIDDEGEVLKEQHYYINTRKSPFLPAVKIPSSDPQHTPDLMTEPLATRFYNHNDSQPSLDQSLYLLPSVQPKAKKIRFTVAAMDPGIVEVGVRPYLEYQRDPKKINIAWQRMSRRQHETLSNASVYPSFLISKYERDNLMSSYWKPLGPLGVLGKDYEIETLYLRQNIAPTLPADIIVPDGLFASPNHWVTIVLDKPQLFTQEQDTSLSRYRIKWYSIEKKDNRTPKYMQLRWQGKNFKQQRQWQGKMQEQVWEGNIASGLLQIIPNDTAILKIYRRSNRQWLDVTPDKKRSRSFICLPKAPVYYSLAPGSHKQSLKISGRKFKRAGQGDSRGLFYFTLRTYTKGGKLLARDNVALNHAQFPYRHFSDSAIVNGHVSEASTRFIDAHKSSHRLRIDCSTPTLVTVNSRPWRHPITRNLPLDGNSWYSYKSREPAWFTMQPDNVENLIVNKRYHNLLWYFKPIEGNSTIASGQFTWNALSSQDMYALEKQIFSNRSSEQETRMKVRGASFQALEGLNNLLFAGKSDQKILRPTAIYLKDSHQAQTVEVWLDNVLAIKTTVAGKSGKIHLPNIPAGQHDIEIRTKKNNINWFINNTAQSKRSHLLRSAFPLILEERVNEDHIKESNYSLTLPIEISDDPQKLSIWLFAPQNEHTLNCQLTLKANRRTSSKASHSFRHFNYHISSEQYPLSHVLHQKEGAVHGPIPLLVHLDEDLTAQSASASLHCDQAGVLASAGVISAGITPFYDFKERLDAQ